MTQKYLGMLVGFPERNADVRSAQYETGSRKPKADSEVCLKVSKDKGKAAEEMLTAWQEQAAKLSAEEISREDYDQWRYNYPKFDTTQHWAKVPSKELSDALVETFKDMLPD